MVKTSVSEEIVQQILALVKSDVLRPGDRLPPERELCKQFGVGRASLREGLRSLSTMGVLQGRVGEGTFVSSDSAGVLEKAIQWGLLLDPKQVEDLIETRLMLESRTAALAAERATPDTVSAIETRLNEMETATGDPSLFLESDLRFHTAIAEASGNSILVSMLTTIRGHLHQWIRKSLEEPATHTVDDRIKLSLEQHGSIVAAIRDQDSSAAKEAMRGHILSSSTDIKSSPTSP